MTPQQQHEFGVFLVEYAPELAFLVTALLSPLIVSLVAKCFPKNND